MLAADGDGGAGDAEQGGDVADVHADDRVGERHREDLVGAVLGGDLHELGERGDARAGRAEDDRVAHTAESGGHTAAAATMASRAVRESGRRPRSVSDEASSSSETSPGGPSPEGVNPDGPKTAAAVTYALTTRAGRR